MILIACNREGHLILKQEWKVASPTWRWTNWLSFGSSNHIDSDIVSSNNSLGLTSYTISKEQLF